MSEGKPTAVEWIKPPDFHPAEPLSYTPVKSRAAVASESLPPLGVNWSAEDVAKCLAVFWNLGLTYPDDPGQRMEQDGPTVTLLDTAGKPQRFRLVREFPELGSDS